MQQDLVAAVVYGFLAGITGLLLLAATSSLVVGLLGIVGGDIVRWIAAVNRLAWGRGAVARVEPVLDLTELHMASSGGAPLDLTLTEQEQEEPAQVVAA